MSKLCDEATAFACELLMPKDKFDEYVSETSCNVGDVANHFQVPSMSVRIRAAQLGYDGHELRDGFIRRFVTPR